MHTKILHMCTKQTSSFVLSFLFLFLFTQAPHLFLHYMNLIATLKSFWKEAEYQ